MDARSNKPELCYTKVFPSEMEGDLASLTTGEDEWAEDQGDHGKLNRARVQQILGHPCVIVR
ncbi:hypothetical protein VCV18_005833 [Metarhizium anisopliae]